MKTGKISTLTLAIALALSASVAAQDNDSDQNESNNNTEENAELGSIQVTARRRTETLRDVPISVTAISGQDLADAGAQDITYLNQVVPNTTLEVSRGTSNTLTAFIRGIGQQDPVAGFEAGVGIYIDDVYLNRPQAAVLDIYDVERVEVLRGPQGTLYGRNTIGGAVKYVTRRLGRTPTASIRGAIGSFSQQDLVVSGETPIGSTAAIGGAIATFNRNGYGTNLNLDEENYDKDVMAARASFEWEPSYDFFLRLSGDYYKDDSNPVGGHRLIPGLFSGAPVLDDVYNSRSGIQGKNETEAQSVTLLMEYDFNPAWQFKSITNWYESDNTQQIDFDALPAVDLDVATIYENEQFSQEFQLNYTSELISGVAGFYYLDANAFGPFDVRLYQLGALLNLPEFNAFTLGDVDTESWSFFTDISFNLAGFFDLNTGLELSVGGRYTSDERSSRVLRQNMLGESEFFGGDPIVFATTSDFQGSETFTDFTPRVSLAWQPTDNQNLYISWAQGFKGGSFDPRGLTTAAPDFNGDGTVSEDEVFEFMKFEPEEVDTWEVGAKSRWADGRVNTSLALFHSDYTNIQVPGSIGVDSDGDGVFDTFAGVTTNAGKATVQGVEFEMSALLGRNMMTTGDSLMLNTAVGYIDADYDEFITAVADPATGATALEDVSDQRVFQNTPDWTGHLNLAYERPLSLFGADGTFGIMGAWSYRGETNQFEIPSDFLDQPSYSLYDMHLTWKRMDGRYEIGLHGRNLGDKQYITSGYVFATPDGSASTLGLEGVMNAFYGAPRTITLTGTINF
ncbi:TonB-dependent receptor [Wenzhouxiangella marina]|uniref:TonB-denpendent receptor n=1 Tax=Wenzhouxiangella marina TaxID=1579979 RepID=A0A0K0XYK1_9GAMM|nr:TonB-dependent receptor [Wenzhouxiangella marina]AKS42769.1 TonB-denpendent receptor [Wenzhouxiangella marina]MBB6087553.1 iron complex outermembrane receptor protein [Wenzhouxiangella marina]